MNADRTRHAGVRAAGALAALALTAGGSLAFAAAASAEDREVPLLNIEAEATPATVEVTYPADGMTFYEPPRFSGFAQGGATVTITVNGAVVGEEVVPTIGDPVEGESSPWAIDVPEAQLPAEGTFDATVTQEFQGATQSVTITGLSVDVFGALITNPLPEDEVDGDVIFSGEAYTEGTIALLLQGTTEGGAEVSAVAFSEEAPAAEVPGAEAADPVEWSGEFTVEQGTDRDNWTFDPGEAIEVGDYEVSVGVVVGEDIDLGNTVSFRVATPGTGDDTGSESGDETGGDETGGDESGSESGDASGDEAGDDSGAESGAESGSEEGSENGAESGADNGAESGAEDGAESGSDDGTENGGGGDLPDTGPDTMPWALAGLALLLSGAALVVIRAQRSAA